MMRQQAHCGAFFFHEPQACRHARTTKKTRSEPENLSRFFTMTTRARFLVITKLHWITRVTGKAVHNSTVSVSGIGSRENWRLPKLHLLRHERIGFRLSYYGCIEYAVYFVGNQSTIDVYPIMTHVHATLVDESVRPKTGKGTEGSRSYY